MPFDPCEPCSCIPASLDDRSFHQAALVVLCGILTSLGGGNDVYAYQTFCDPVSGEPVLVQTATNPTTGALTGLAGYLLDGTAYPDPVSLLIACTGGGGGGGNVNLTGINGVTPSVGNGTSDTGTIRVAIASNNSPIAVTGTFFQATQPVSGTVTVTQATGTNLHVVVDSLPAVSGSVTVVQPTGTNLHTVVDSGVITTVSAVTAITNALPAGTNALGSVTTTRTSLTASSPTFATVGITSASALAANASRKGLTVVNTSSNYVSVAWGTAAVLYSGQTLFPNGGTLNMGEYDFNTGQMFAIASGSGSNISIQEFT